MSVSSQQSCLLLGECLHSGTLQVSRNGNPSGNERAGPVRPTWERALRYAEVEDRVQSWQVAGRHNVSTRAVVLTHRVLGGYSL